MSSELFASVSKLLSALFSVLILVRCLWSMLSYSSGAETWGTILDGERSIPIRHWENIIGRSRSCDICLADPEVGRTHAVLVRSDRGVWKLYDVFSLGRTRVNGEKVGAGGTIVVSGDELSFSDYSVRFASLSPEKRGELEQARRRGSAGSGQRFTLLLLTAFQFLLVYELTESCRAQDYLSIVTAFAALTLAEWGLYLAMRLMRRRGFETEILAFYLTSLGMTVAAGSDPAGLQKELILIAISLGMFLLMGWWLRNLRRAKAMRIPIAVLALLLLALNLVAGSSIFGAKNWLVIGGYSFQPSELVKVAYIYCGASALDTLYRRKNLLLFIGFSAVCVVSLALMGDFGSALIFFVTFLVISFMRSGSLATVLLAVSGAGLVGFLVLTVKPYIAQRFSAWGHVWEDVNGAGYQQTRAMSAAASGGLFGKGAGAGWLHGIFAADTDMVFGVLCEELGLIVAVCAVLCLAALACFAVFSARHSRSSYHAIAACAAVTLLLTQLSLNVFGSMDLLPFTGVTFPFVSRGGTSLVSCWMLMAFIKAADTRPDASFVVRPHRKKRTYVPEEEATEA